MTLAVVLTLAGCGAPTPVNDPDIAAVPEGGLVVEFQQTSLLEAVGPDGEPVPYDDGSHAVVVNYAIVNHEPASVAVADLPVVQLFDGQGGAWSADMQFVRSGDEMNTDWPGEVSAGTTIHAAAVFTIPGDAWQRPGWTAGWRGSEAGERTPISPGPTPLSAD